MQSLTQRLANPTRFMALSGTILPWLWAAASLTIAYALYLTFFVAPEDYQQGQTVKIMFIHVPAAWLAMGGYLVVAISSFGLLVFRHPLADVSAKAAAPLGAMFTALALITGSLWGKPMWGTWWVWDARLTSVLVLLLFYLGYIALRAAMDDETRGGRAAAILALVGLINLPIVKFSVDWWNSLHQGASVFRADGPAMTNDYLIPLLLMGLGYMAAFGSLWLVRIRAEVWRRKAMVLALKSAEA